MLVSLIKKVARLRSVLKATCPDWQSLLFNQLSVGQATIVGSFLTTGLIVLIQHFWGLQSLELMALDQIIRLQAKPETDPRLLIVEITEADLATQKQWPISDEILARAIQKLQQDRPCVIGLDLYRNLSHPPGTSALQTQLQAPNLIVIAKLPDETTDGVPSPAGVPPERIGFNDFVIDPDGVVRRNFLYAYEGEQKFYSFSLQMSLAYFKEKGYPFQISPNNLLQIDDIEFKPLRYDSGGYESIDAIGLQTLIDYRKKEVAERVSLSQVLNNQVRPEQVRDRIVLIGLTGISIQDNFLTPHSAVAKGDPHWPGVLIHAQLTHQILGTVLDKVPLFWFWPQWGEVLWIWGWALVGGLLVWRIHSPIELGLATFGSWGSMIGILWFLFSQSGWVPVVSPSLAFIFTIASILAYKSVYILFYDSLTGLPNRTQLIRLLSFRTNSTANKSNKSGKDFAMLFMGLDRFNVINDTLGYRVGDRLLQTVRDRLKQSIKRQGIVARVGGDEFTILLDGLQDLKAVEVLADQIQQTIKKPVHLGEREVSISSSIGIAFAQADYMYQPEDLLRNAHTAMHRAKALGKSRYEVVVVGMQKQMARRFEIETDLRHALERQELCLHYQPIVDLKTGKLAGFEALARWWHPQQGFVSPAEFVNSAEETDLIISLGQWVLEEACCQLQMWQNKFQTELPLLMNVNLSSKQFGQTDLVGSVKETLNRIGLAPHYLKLEITESIAMDNIEASMDTLLGLKDLHLQLSIDDFGMGYSSLSYLCQFPVDTLKVDRSFVSRMTSSDADRAIVQTIITLSHALGMNVTAEGIETAEQRQMLTNLNCEYGQGYLFSKPLSAEEATLLLKQQTQW
jgi:diguanylate cyclase (GGDEF)-like protein